MTEPRQLVFQRDDELRELLPAACSVGVSCYEPPEIQEIVAATLQGIFQSLARTGMDLRGLDGVTLTADCAEASSAIQTLPEGQLPLEAGEQPNTMEMARTVPVWRDNELRFHIVMRAGLGIGMLGGDSGMQALAFACLAHEAAHVEHEGHLYRTFPEIYGKSIPCGDRSHQTFLKAMDVWSEYAACRSSAMFRPEAAEEFERVFCRALEDSLPACKRRIVAYREGGDGQQIFVDIQQLFGDVFICAGYFLGHLDGLGLDLERRAPKVVALFADHPEIADLVRRLKRTLHELWLAEYGWRSIEVFSPIYELLCSMMALHGFVFAHTDKEWRIVMSEEDHIEVVTRNALASWLERED
ncbi:MAG TPA: hypothetical protein VHX63_13955 [Acidobacteriaceae bacterium]|jgi:hypothetical protein|nr:hypothetical protein [Acidobacteriaceae bacterium]